VAVNFSIEEMRNYITIIPFVLILALLFLSTFEKSFLRPVDALLGDDSSKDDVEKKRED
jgi:hypothetical protein